MDAARVVYGDRWEQWGDPKRSLEQIAALWSAYLKDQLGPGGFLTPEDVALMMALLKISRIITGAPSRDSYVDGSGYFELAYLVEKERQK